LALLGMSALLAAPAARAGHDYENCAGFIDSLPATINSPGTWCLAQNLSTSAGLGYAIGIGVDNVTLDCNDFRLDGSGGGAASTMNGVYAQDRNNVTVRNCQIRGFYRGVLVQGATGSGHLVENNRFDGNLYAAIDVEGDGSTVRRNRAYSTGGAVDPSGIRIASAVDVRDNVIDGVVAKVGGGGNAFGISGSVGASGSITGNHIRGLDADGGGSAFGIANIGSTRMIVRRNDLVGDGTGFGLLCNTGSTRVRDNTISAFATPIDTCSSGAGNVIRP
jgi:hypothetical protein